MARKLEKSGSKGEGQMKEGSGEEEVDDTSSTEAVVGAPRKETHFVEPELAQEQVEHRSHHHGDHIPGWHRHELTPMKEVETRDER